MLKLCWLQALSFLTEWSTCDFLLYIIAIKTWQGYNFFLTNQTVKKKEFGFQMPIKSKSIVAGDSYVVKMLEKWIWLCSSVA